ncbi:replication protein A 32 kDa subunit A-like [Punica granatum]|uniref:Uncharacterized protein n=2 Tax=Punica granatum TaxID=22663 RepID=A0A218W3H4_PUNGR|nr:replication protein A 32 kDa subunit A-like [Punica granatum]OWM67325.1 hypothetical protein CDL15_Pgr000777 [Punica granatum]PKI39108.1 hypothetical protein CRG98_040532 [Punica granatum]
MMFSSSQFEATAPFSQSTQSAEPSSAAKSRGTEGLVPVTVKQLSEAYQSGDEKSNFQIDGADVTNVTLVGMVDQKVERVTDVTFALDDGTGRVECRRWINEGFDSKEMNDIQDGMYARVIGHLRGSQGGKQIAAFAVRPVLNFDEVTFHFIDCIHQHLLKSRSKVDATNQSKSAEDSNSTITSMGTQPTASGHVTAPSNEFSGQYSVGGLKSCDQKVLEYLQQNFSIEKGVHRDEISKQLKIPVDKIMEAIRTLEDEGLIYSTIDEYHYKSTTES